jgi:antibiotic biosynthesis monooxygenase (ABM) superfamily enzyme
MIPFDRTAADHAGPRRETAGVDPVPPSDEPSRARSWLVRVTTTLAAWLVAFSVVMTLLTLFGTQLESLSPALRALAMSGVLVMLMANLVMPALNVAVARWMASHPPHEVTLPRKETA